MTGRCALLAEADSHALPYAVRDGLQQVFDARRGAAPVGVGET
jgi:hypothetical protein